MHSAREGRDTVPVYELIIWSTSNPCHAIYDIISWWNYMMIISHYNDVIMSLMTSQTTVDSIVFSTVCSGAKQRKYQSSASLAFVRVIHRRPVDSPHKGPVAQKMSPFDDVIMYYKWGSTVPICVKWAPEDSILPDKLCPVLVWMPPTVYSYASVHFFFWVDRFGRHGLL